VFKICPVCGEKNSIDDFLCKGCMSDISSVIPSEDKEDILILKNDETTLNIKPNEIIGREYNGIEYLSNYTTVSRKHCQFFFENGKWYIQDLNSTNKTYLNSKTIEPLKKIEVKNGDEVSFSKKVKFKIEV
jgi:pSer/pThr/pTyr-binding forkhead associated (FHA) protein